MDSGYQQKPNGSMLAKPELKISDTVNWVILPGLKKILIIGPMKLDKSNLTNGGCMICWEMFGNGVQIFMMKLFTEHTVSFVAAVGATKKGA